MKDIIDKAVKGGWDSEKFLSSNFIHLEDYRLLKILEDKFNDIIFSHDFLKGFFGEHLVCSICGEVEEKCVCPPNSHDWVVSWQYHAQQLVLSTDRKEYLERFI